MLESWLRLHYLRGFSHRQKRLLVNHLGSPDKVANTSPDRLRSLLSATESVANSQNPENFGRFSAIDLVIEKDLHQLAQCGAGYLPFTDRSFPTLLNQIDPPPLGLFFLGNKNLLNSPQISVVGSRRASRSGMQTAQMFAKELARSGFTVTSGAASGIDTYAHIGALEADGNTIAVTATGIDQFYPVANKRLIQSIYSSGLVVTEYPPGTPPRRRNFPQRNRIISGLSLGTLVVEAGIRSGSLITARLAAEQGREVFAVPGSIHAASSKGCHYLLRQGAALVETLEDIVAELNWGTLRPSPPSSENDAKPTGLDPDQQKVYDLIEYSPSPIDQIISLSGLTAEQVSSILVRLELQGLVSDTAGGYQKLPGAHAPANTAKTE